MNENSLCNTCVNCYCIFQSGINCIKCDFYIPKTYWTKSSDDPLFARQGWVCPKCGRVFSPDTSMCLYCGSAETVTNITTTSLPSLNSSDTFRVHFEDLPYYNQKGEE